MSELSQTLLHWYDAQGRDLPWRHTADPYKIWVSETMLQQTRVEAVRAKYEAFVAKFPDISALANATEEEVLGSWQGLGYYARARRLWQAAQHIASQWPGSFPTHAEFLALPGVGDYTANAVFSIAFTKPVAAVDGNVLRVASRWFSISGDIQAASTKRLVQDTLTPHLPHNRPGDFNQAIMDLGAVICIPKKPKCHTCPMSTVCQAYAQGTAETLPLRGKKRPPRKVLVHVALMHSTAGHLLLRRRTSGGFLRGMWELPWWEQTEQATQVAEARAPYAHTYEIALETGHLVPAGSPWQQEYIFSHRHWVMTIQEYHWSGYPALPEPKKTGTEYRWVLADDLTAIAMATVFRQLITNKGKVRNKDTLAPTEAATKLT